MEENNILYFGSALAKRITYYSELKQITYSRWAIKAGVSPASIYDLINGKSSELKLTTVKKLCDVFKISLPEFFNVDYISTSIIKDEDFRCGKD